MLKQYYGRKSSESIMTIIHQQTKNRITLKKKHYYYTILAILPFLIHEILTAQSRRKCKLDTVPANKSLLTEQLHREKKEPSEFSTKTSR